MPDSRCGRAAARTNEKSDEHLEVADAEVLHREEGQRVKTRDEAAEPQRHPTVAQQQQRDGGADHLLRSEAPMQSRAIWGRRR